MVFFLLGVHTTCKRSWQACQDILPTRENPLKRKVIIDPMCPICGYMVEYGFHTLWQCLAAQDAWDTSLVKFQKSHFPRPVFLQVVDGLFLKYTTEEMALIMGLARRIWLRRNDVLHGGVFAHPRVLIQRAIQTMEDFKEAHGLRLEVALHSSAQGGFRWLASSPRCFKANWDASVDCKARHLGCGVVIRDTDGGFVAA
jgi:hypothetical protein